MSEEETTAQEAAEAEPAKHKETKARGERGPGFALGVLAGLIAGAAAATLFAPPAGEERPVPAVPPPLETTPLDRVRALLTLVRQRMQEAREEAQEAAQEIEGKKRARYAELTE